MKKIIKIILLSLIVVSTKAQMPNLFPNNTQKADGILPLKFLGVPTDTIFSKWGLAVKSGTFYIGNGVNWKSAALPTGGGGGSRFGIEDNTGVQNRNVNMQGFNLEVYNANRQRFFAEDGVHFSSIAAYLQEARIEVGDSIGVAELHINSNSFIKTNDGVNSSTQKFSKPIGITDYFIPLKVNNISADSTGNINITLGYTVSTLPLGTLGMTAYVTDATAPTYLGTLTGGGAIKCPVFFNGTAWVSH